MPYFSKNLKTLRESFRLTQSQLADEIGSTKSTISKFESGELEVKPVWKNRIANYFGVDITQMRTREFSYREAETLAQRGVQYSNESILAEEPAEYNASKNTSTGESFQRDIAVHTGAVIDTILTKHHTPKNKYAQEALGRDPRTLQRIIKGEIMADFWIILRVVQDHGESLELFRTGPMPKGHLLAQLADKETIIATQKQLIAQLSKNL